MPRFNNHKRLLKEIERVRQCKVRRMQEEREWESSEEQKDITAIRLIQRSALMSLIDCFSCLISFRAAGLGMPWNREVGVRISFYSTFFTLSFFGAVIS